MLKSVICKICQKQKKRENGEGSVFPPQKPKLLLKKKEMGWLF